MEQQYSVSIGGRHAGKVLVQRQGLYYRFSCKCTLPDNGLYRLTIVCRAQKQDLGILVPTDDGFGLDRKIPVKRIGEGEMVFTIRQNQESVTGTFVPISPEEPFSYISRLKKNFLVIRNGQPGILTD